MYRCEEPMKLLLFFNCQNCSADAVHLIILGLPFWMHMHLFLKATYDRVTKRPQITGNLNLLSVFLPYKVYLWNIVWRLPYVLHHWLLLSDVALRSQRYRRSIKQAQWQVCNPSCSHCLPKRESWWSGVFEQIRGLPLNISSPPWCSRLARCLATGKRASCRATWRIIRHRSHGVHARAWEQVNRDVRGSLSFWPNCRRKELYSEFLPRLTSFHRALFFICFT